MCVCVCVCVCVLQMTRPLSENDTNHSKKNVQKTYCTYIKGRCKSI